MFNLILNTDSYKASHYLQYPPGTDKINSYIETRGISANGPISEFHDNKIEVVFFGLQAFLKEELIFPLTIDDINQAEHIFTMHGEPFNREGWEYILKTYNGYLPLRIEAIPEGTPVPIGTPMVQVVNTDTKVPWLTSYLETALLRAVWYPSTVATISREIKKIIYANLKHTSDDPDGQILFKLHDFGARGVSSYESSAIGGLAHLVNFMGTDTVPALVAAARWYDEPMAGFSIPAAEHSTITSWGKANEKEAYRNMLTKFAKPGKLVAVVSDSYNIYEAADKIWGQELRDEVLNSGATVVIRPDSGNPVSVVTTLLTILGERFGYTNNSKGYRVLHPSVRIIQGDGVDYHSIHQILNEMTGLGWSTDNIAFGMGGALLQKLDRDTFKWAMKANARYAYGQWHDVFKQPIHQSDKKSKAGILSVVRKQDGSIQTIRRENLLYDQDLLQPVFENGHILTPTTLKNVRENAKL